MFGLDRTTSAYCFGGPVLQGPSDFLTNAAVTSNEGLGREVGFASPRDHGMWVSRAGCLLGRGRGHIELLFNYSTNKSPKTKWLSTKRGNLWILEKSLFIWFGTRHNDAFP